MGTLGRLCSTSVPSTSSSPTLFSTYLWVSHIFKVVGDFTFVSLPEHNVGRTIVIPLVLSTAAAMLSVDINFNLTFHTH